MGVASPVNGDISLITPFFQKSQAISRYIEVVHTLIKRSRGDVVSVFCGCLLLELIPFFVGSVY
jgi:hypothetical protein